MSLTNAPEGHHPDNRYGDVKYYFLKDGQHFFQYRTDKFNNKILRATLFNKSIKAVGDVRVTCYEHIVEKSHEDVKEYFEKIISNG